jgi:hypothetical protein
MGLKDFLRNWWYALLKRLGTTDLDNAHHWLFIFSYKINHVNSLLTILYSILYYVSNKNQLKSFVLHVNDFLNINVRI